MVTSQRKEFTSAGKFNISGVFFSGIKYTGNYGGAIYVETAQSSTTSISSSSILSCSCLENGGGIFIKNSEIYIKQVFGSLCKGGPNNSGQFCYLSAFGSNNTVEKSSIEKSGTPDSGHGPTDFRGDFKKIESLNNSLNDCVIYSGLFLPSISQATFSCCTFSNNTSRSPCFYISSGSVIIRKSNILFNKVTNDIFQTYNTFKIEECVILKNSNNGYCFKCGGGTLTIIHCFIDNNKISGSANIEQIPNKPGIDLSVINSFYCSIISLHIFHSNRINYAFSYVLLVLLPSIFSTSIKC